MSGNQLALDNVLVLRARPTLWVSAFWGAPTRAQAEQAIALYERALASSDRYRHFIDFSRLTHADPEVFGCLATWARGARARAEAVHRWQAIVVPAGVLGAVVYGFHRSLGYDVETHFFESTEAAVADRFRGAERRAFEREVLPLLAAPARAGLRAQLRTLLRDQPTLSISDAARALGASSRTLQRQLRDADTSFQAERLEARLALARLRLADPTTKIETVARELGFASRQHFAKLLRTITGAKPSALRLPSSQVASFRPRKAPKRPR